MSTQKQRSKRMFEGLLLMSIVLAVISQLLPETGVRKQQKSPVSKKKTDQKKHTAHKPSQQSASSQNKKQQPCRNSSNRAACNM